MSKERIENLKKYRSAIIYGEIGALIHDLGKCHSKFLLSKLKNSGVSYSHLDILDYEDEKKVIKEIDRDREVKLEDVFCKDLATLSHILNVPLQNEVIVKWGLNKVSLKNLIEFHQIRRDHKKQEEKRKLKESKLISLSQISDKKDSADDRLMPLISQEGKTFISTVFGIEEEINLENLDDSRMKFYSGLSNVLNSINNLKLKVIRRKIFDEWKITRSTVAETRRAANDVTLWDHSYATAAIMKALLVQDVLSNFTISFLEGERVKQHFSFRLNILGVGWDASRILGEAQDLLGISGRERLIEEVKEKVKDILEFEIPVGNCIYEDNNSVCFLVPENINLVLAEIKRKVVSEVAGLSDGVIIPAICINKKANPYPSELITEVLEELNKRAKAPISQEKIEIRDIKWIKEWNGIKEGEVCVECGKRPRMKDRDICWRCQEFRIEGLKEIKGAFAEVQDETVWLDEIADKNGNIALICGSIPLEKWLNGEVLKTIFVKTLNDVLNPERVIDGRNPWKIWENKNYSQIRSVLEKKRYEGIVDVVRTFIQESEIQESEHQKQADKRNIQVFSNFNVPKNPLPVYLSIKSRTGLDPKRFAEVLFTKPPSPSRLLRIWTEIQEFLEELFNSTQTFIKEKVGGHCLRLKIKPRFEARDEEFFGRGENKYQTYDLEEIFDSRIRLPKTDLWWDGEYFYTTTRLENYTEGETLEKKQRIIEENVENLKIKDFPIVLRVKKSIKRRKEEVKVKVGVEDVGEVSADKENSDLSHHLSSISSGRFSF